MKFKTKLAIGLGSAVLALGAQSAYAACSDVTYAKLKKAAEDAKALGAVTGGYQLDMWVTMVNEAGTVCYVYTTGDQGSKAGNSAWLGSRVISAQKAFTANAFSLDGYAISTANLYSAVQPGGSLFGLQLSNPVDPTMAYQGSPGSYGKSSDPMNGKRVGGINVFGGGLALYKGSVKVGAIGLSGDTSCRDHAFAWRVRGFLGMHPADGHNGITTFNKDFAGDVQTDNAHKLTGAIKGDEMIFKLSTSDASNYWNAWAQPLCPNSIPAATTDNGTLVIPTPTP